MGLSEVNLRAFSRILGKVRTLEYVDYPLPIGKCSKISLWVPETQASPEPYIYTTYINILMIKL